MITVEEFVERIQLASFKEKGRSYELVDCWGIPYLGYRDVLGIQLPSYVEEYKVRDVKGTDHLHGLIQANMQNWHPVNQPQLFDVALFRIENRLWHVGLIVNHKIKQVLHAEARLGVFVERLSVPMWTNRLEGIYRYAR